MTNKNEAEKSDYGELLREKWVWPRSPVEEVFSEEAGPLLKLPNCSISEYHTMVEGANYDALWLYSDCIFIVTGLESPLNGKKFIQLDMVRTEKNYSQADWLLRKLTSLDPVLDRWTLMSYRHRAIECFLNNIENQFLQENGFMELDRLIVRNRLLDNPPFHIDFEDLRFTSDKLHYLFEGTSAAEHFPRP